MRAWLTNCLRQVPHGVQVRRLLGLIALIHGSLRLLQAQAALLSWGQSVLFGVLLLAGSLWLLATSRWRSCWVGRLAAVWLAAVWGAFATAVWSGSNVSGGLAILYSACCFYEAGNTRYDP